MKKLKHAKCPTCGRVGPWFDGRFGPFCSPRCRLVDLGKWLGEEHRISEPLPPDYRPEPDPLAGDETN